MKLKFLLFSVIPLLSMTACNSSGGSGNFSSNPNEEEEIVSSSSQETPSSEDKEEVIDYSKGQAMNAKLGKGINMGNTFDATCETCWGAGPIEEYQVKAIKEAGFNSVRLPVRWDLETLKELPYTVSEKYLARVKEVVGWINGAGLIAIINIHHHQSFLTDTLSSQRPNPETTEKNLARVDSIWRQVADYFSKVSNDSLVFEMFNEPRWGVSADIHNQMIARTHPIMRKNNPGRTLMYGSYMYNSFGGIKSLVLPKDGNIIFTPHYYVPSSYALQGEGNRCPESPVTWEGTSSQVAAMTDDFKKMRSLADQYYPGGLPINIGEFGATYCGGLKSRVKWVTLFVKLAKEQNFSWNYWGFTNIGGYEIYDKGTKTWSDQETLNALLK